jgi:hypothetical protein
MSAGGAKDAPSVRQSGWLPLTFGLAYLWFRHACRLGLTCDVGGVDYRWVYIPSFAFVLGTPLGLSALLVLRRAHRSERPTRGQLLTGATIFLVCSFGAPMLLTAVNAVTCDNRLWRRADGAYASECVLRAQEKTSANAHVGR